MHRALTFGANRLNQIAKDALKRLLSGGNLAVMPFLSREEKKELAELLAAITATANLLGRAQIRDRADKARRPTSESLQERELPDSSPLPMPPERALDYFRRLVPTLGRDPLFDELMRRQAFTLAVATEEQLLQKVKAAIDARLATGQGISTAPREIARILGEAGVHPSNPTYSEMLFRTNAIDSYNQGAQEELRQVAETFPVWKYSAVMDDRTRPDHAALNGKYFSAQTPFTSVRPEPYNCRCTFIPVTAWDWEELQKNGARLES